ncbi:MAG: triose-phosphate isomerase [Parcubacteria group bacterium]|nr:triose-phosphate isomerase [Parcubacteria group bacterium]
MRGNNHKQPLVIANWKMKLTASAALDLARKIKKASAKYRGAEVVVCPSFTELGAVADILDGSGAALGAQDCFWEEQGAFTGEVSPKQLAAYGVATVIVGHSERREHLRESGDMIHKKIRVLLSLGMRPVLCVGESFDERAEGQKEVSLAAQVHQALDGLWLTRAHELVVAYEPVWVIGSGQDIDPNEIEHTHQVIRQSLCDIFTPSVVDEHIKIIYGGSVDPENVGRYMAKPSVAGVLVGTASLDATRFSAVVAGALKS